MALSLPSGVESNAAAAAELQREMAAMGAAMPRSAAPGPAEATRAFLLPQRCPPSCGRGAAECDAAAYWRSQWVAAATEQRAVRAECDRFVRTMAGEVADAKRDADWAKAQAAAQQSTATCLLAKTTEASVFRVRAVQERRLGALDSRIDEAHHTVGRLTRLINRVGGAVAAAQRLRREANRNTSARSSIAVRRDVYGRGNGEREPSDKPGARAGHGSRVKEHHRRRDMGADEWNCAEAEIGLYGASPVNVLRRWRGASRNTAPSPFNYGATQSSGHSIEQEGGVAAHNPSMAHYLRRPVGFGAHSGSPPAPDSADECSMMSESSEDESDSPTDRSEAVMGGSADDAHSFKDIWAVDNEAVELLRRHPPGDDEGLDWGEERDGHV
eukprot:Selendium_serpulae@DN4280_c0_g1_i2.p1